MTEDPDRASNHHPSGELVDHLFRSRAGQMVAYLTRLLGPEHLDIAEEVVQDALRKALQSWPFHGVPDNPAGWLFRVARNGAVDAIRRINLASRKSADLLAAAGNLTGYSEPASLPGGVEFGEQLRDDELQMLLMCCHPRLPREARVALSSQNSRRVQHQGDCESFSFRGSYCRAKAGACQTPDSRGKHRFRPAFGKRAGCPPRFRGGSSLPYV